MRWLSLILFVSLFCYTYQTSNSTRIYLIRPCYSLTFSSSSSSIDTSSLSPTPLYTSSSAELIHKSSISSTPFYMSFSSSTPLHKSSSSGELIDRSSLSSSSIDTSLESVSMESVSKKHKIIWRNLMNTYDILMTKSFSVFAEE